MSISCLGITLEHKDTIVFHSDRSEETAWIAFKMDGAQCEIRMQRRHVESLHDQLPGVLGGLDQVAAEDEACAQAEVAAEQARKFATRALEKAQAAEEAGAHQVAVSLREAAAEVMTTTDAVEAVLRAFAEAVVEADRAADRLLYTTWQADNTQGQARDDHRPAALATSS